MDATVPGSRFFQQSGTLTIAAGSTQLNGIVNATLSNVTLVEVTIDKTTFVSTPVPNGSCLHLASAPVAFALTWNCDPTYYNDQMACDCGCGSMDPDCADNALSSCDFCDDTGSCSSLACANPAVKINTANNGVCVP